MCRVNSDILESSLVNDHGSRKDTKFSMHFDGQPSLADNLVLR